MLLKMCNRIISDKGRYNNCRWFGYSNSLQVVSTCYLYPLYLEAETWDITYRNLNSPKSQMSMESLYNTLSRRKIYLRVCVYGAVGS